MRRDASRGRKNRLVPLFFWEFVQNLPLIAGFLAGLHFWRGERPWLAGACLLGGSVVGSLLIWATESQMVEGHREPLRAVLVNVAVMAALMFVVVLYLAAGWSRWWTDLLVGGLVGMVLGIVQDLAARSPVGLRHCAAFALSFALGLAGVRLLAANLPLLINVLVITGVVTGGITLMDYRQGGVVPPDENLPA